MFTQGFNFDSSIAPLKRRGKSLKLSVTNSPVTLLVLVNYRHRLRHRKWLCLPWHYTCTHPSTYLWSKHCQLEKERPPSQSREDKVAVFVRILLAFSAKTKTPKVLFWAGGPKKNFDREGVGKKDFGFVKIILNFFGVGR